MSLGGKRQGVRCVRRVYQSRELRGERTEQSKMSGKGKRRGQNEKVASEKSRRESGTSRMTQLFRGRRKQSKKPRQEAPRPLTPTEDTDTPPKTLTEAAPPYLDMNVPTCETSRNPLVTPSYKPSRRLLRWRQHYKESRRGSKEEPPESAAHSRTRRTSSQKRVVAVGEAEVAAVTPENEVKKNGMQPPSLVQPVQPKPRPQKKAPPPLVPEEAVPAVQRALRRSGSSDENDCSDDKEDESNSHHQIGQAVSALDQAGNALFEKGKYDEAFARYERALVLKRLALRRRQGDDDDDMDPIVLPPDAHKKSVLASVATSINNMTYIKQRSGQASMEETMASYLKSLQIKRDILGPDHLSVGKTLNNIGSVFYLKQEYEPALKAYKDAHAIMEKQLGANHLDVGTVISNIGDVYAATERKELALEKYRRALDIRWQNLGKRDPKVVRLMEQIAALETGKQPKKMEDELSDSEHEGFQAEYRERHAVFVEDCQSLQEELQDDMKFFDLLERQMAIDMLKDKTRIFREMREIGQEDVEKDAAVVTPSSASPPVGNRPAPSDASFPVPEQTVAPAVSQRSEQKKSKPSVKLTEHDRKQALSSVRDRLERLRASRQQTLSARSLATNVTSPAPHRSYMNSTAASAAKTMPVL